MGNKFHFIFSMRIGWVLIAFIVSEVAPNILTTGSFPSNFSRLVSYLFSPKLKEFSLLFGFEARHCLTVQEVIWSRFLLYFTETAFKLSNRPCLMPLIIQFKSGSRKSLSPIYSVASVLVSTCFDWSLPITAMAHLCCYIYDLLVFCLPTVGNYTFILCRLFPQLVQFR